MNPRLLIAVFVPIKDVAGEACGELATGYPVGKDLILTARHVLQPKLPHCRDDGRPIKIRWHGYNSGWIDIPDENIIWQSQGKLDAALIRCPRPPEARGWGIVSEERPVTGMSWHSAGFPRATRYDNVRESTGFGGSVGFVDDQNDCFELIEVAPPDSDDNWRGTSGMPVFVSGKILGVVQSVPPNFRSKRVRATPTWKLLEHAEFKKALDWDDQNERLERARKLLSGVLQKSDEVTRELAAKLKLPSSEMPKCRKEVVEKLLTETPPLEWLFEQALLAQEACRDKKDQDGARVAARLMLTILPAIHDAGVVSDVRRRKGDPAENLIALPTKLSTLAEIIMAGADRREAQLWPPATKLVFPEGMASLPEPPESGRDAENKQFSRDWRAHLLETFGADLDRFKTAFQNYLKERFIPSDLRERADISEDELLDSVAVQLRQEATAGNALTYYFIVRMPEENEEARQKREQALAELKKKFFHIAFLRLAGTEPLDIEWSRYGKLRDLIYDPETHLEIPGNRRRRRR